MPYLKLWHGHRHPDEQLDGWGEDGPTFGLFPFFHMTYGCEIKFGDDGYCLNLVEEFVYYDGMYYGDWSFCDQLDKDMQSRLVTFDSSKADRCTWCAAYDPWQFAADQIQTARIVRAVISLLFVERKFNHVKTGWFSRQSSGSRSATRTD